MKLSLCIATFNEQQNIHYPLDSAYDLVDEVIIVDGGSKDHTVEKAKSYGKKVKVYIEDNPAMFHINKQKAIERAKGEWILQLDADEELSEELKQEIRAIVIPSQARNLATKGSVNKKRDASLDFSVASLPRNDKMIYHSQMDLLRIYPSKTALTTLRVANQHKMGIVAYYIPRKNFFLTRFLNKGGQYPDYTIRLYRNGYARFPCKTVHENVEIINPNSSRPDFAEASTGGQARTINNYSSSDEQSEESRSIGYLKNPILHYADPNFSRYLQRWDRYTNLEATLLLQEVKSQKSKVKNLIRFIDYFIIKPPVWFFMTYFRHLGFLDGFPGFVFALFSSIRFWAIYTKFWSNFKKGTS